MYQRKTTAGRLISGFSQIIRFFGWSQEPESSRNGSDDHGRRDTSDSRPDCGGFNEAFIMQQWTGYNPHH